MTVNLSRGYKKPVTGDSGATFFPDLEFNIDRLNDHDHDGVDSNRLTVLSSTSYVQSAAPFPWVLEGETYKKTITLPAFLVSAGFSVSMLNYQLRNFATGEILYLGNKYNGQTAFDVYSNDNSLAINVVYTT